MKVIYHCYGGAHSSVVAAHLHLGDIPMTGRVTPEEICSLPEFDQADAKDWGKPFLIGVDNVGNEVYIMGLGNQTLLCCRAITSLACQLGKADEILLVKTLPTIGLITRIGGFASKVLGIKIGRTLAAIGIVNSLPGLRRLVGATKEYLEWKTGNG